MDLKQTGFSALPNPQPSIQPSLSFWKKLTTPFNKSLPLYQLVSAGIGNAEMPKNTTKAASVAASREKLTSFNFLPGF